MTDLNHDLLSYRKFLMRKKFDNIFIEQNTVLYRQLTINLNKLNDSLWFSHAQLNIFQKRHLDKIGRAHV